MYYVYLLKSRDQNYFYTGCTNGLKIRIAQHNRGEVVSTKFYKPFKLIYFGACLNGKDAYNREKYLKTR